MYACTGASPSPFGICGLPPESNLGCAGDSLGPRAAAGRRVPLGCDALPRAGPTLARAGLLVATGFWEVCAVGFFAACAGVFFVFFIGVWVDWVLRAFSIGASACRSTHSFFDCSRSRSRNRLGLLYFHGTNLDWIAFERIAFGNGPDSRLSSYGRPVSGDGAHRRAHASATKAALAELDSLGPTARPAFYSSSPKASTYSGITVPSSSMIRNQTCQGISSSRKAPIRNS